ncbi:cytochrome c biogenesis CcdA family protein [Dyella subtropica]|uniref:cytochrome c biogenesis CcdA family protein n=1 Tax=Dyella subtropica TaxID=2992127 RepID=UPI00224FAC77|nr:cytochrome c biogenesis CcdA family protein [Dyella subtropica]
MSTDLNPLFAYAAGALTILSPCVLPLVPIVLGSAAQRHRWGPLALAMGLVISFTFTGFAIAATSTSTGLDGTTLRHWSAILLILVGAILLLPKVELLFEKAAGPLATWAGERQARLDRFGLSGQAGIGVLLGLVWSPCVGPTLGAATLLAAQGKNLAQVALVMAAFGLGIATVLLAIAMATRGVLSRWRSRMMNAGSRGRKMLGALLIIVGLLIVTGADHVLESIIIGILPDWLTNLSTSL